MIHISAIFYRRSLPGKALLTLALSAALCVVLSADGDAQGQTANRALQTIEERTAQMRKLDGFFPLYYDSVAAHLYMEIPRLGVEVLHVVGLASGLGSNDIGLDRGQLQGSRIVFFERAGPKVMMVQPNYDFRSSSPDALERRAVKDAFARSVLWGFNAVAESDGGARVLVDMTDFILRDATNMAQQLSPGSYRFDASRSSIYLPMTQNFPLNTDMEVELTFVSQPGAGGGRGGAFFEGVGSVAASSEAASMRAHHSFVQLPDSNYKPRIWDARSGYSAMQFEDYSAPLGQPLTQRFIRRHRLEKRNPSAAVSDPVEPIIYYLDPGTPEPLRTALLDGARWWNQAFEAAGYRNAFQVELLPADASPLDIRYNVINWVHRSTRGWSYGASVGDPRTGEIIKGVVTLGSLRVRQDWLIAEGLLQPYRNGDEATPEIERWALQRIKQLSAHEVGHTLGLGHNYYDSDAGRISVLDYPHPLVTLDAAGRLDHSEVYTDEIGEWDKVSIIYGYQHYPSGVNEEQALRRTLDSAWALDLRYMTNQDLGAHGRVDQWSNGTDAAAELTRMLEVRRVALATFGENAIKRGQPLAQLEEALVPLYMHHRYQVDAAVSSIGGMLYIYAMRGDGRVPTTMVPAAQQRKVLSALADVLRPANLALPRTLLQRIPARPPGYGSSRELFPRMTGSMFDALTPAMVAADQVIASVLSSDRAARLVQQNTLDATLPGLGEVIDSLVRVAFAPTAGGSYEAEIQRAVQRILVDRLMALAGNAPMSQVRAIANMKLRDRQVVLAAASATTPVPSGGGQESGAREATIAHASLLAEDITRFFERPANPVANFSSPPSAPPGAPIGDPGLDWLNTFDLACGWRWLY